MEPMDIVGKSKEDASLPKGRLIFIFYFIVFKLFTRFALFVCIFD